MNISRPYLNIRKSVLIQSNFPTNLKINPNSLNTVIFCGISHVPAVSNYLLRYEQMSITFQIIHLLTKQRCILHSCRQLVYMYLYFCIIYANSSKGLPHLFQVPSNANLKMWFLLFKITQKLYFP